MKKFISILLGLLPFALMAEKEKVAPVDSEPSEKKEQIIEAKKAVVKKTFDERLKDKVQALNEAEYKRKLENGAKEFMFGENKVLARDQENANRKARNLGYIS